MTASSPTATTAGRQARRPWSCILERDALFSAVVASNDLSCIGAVAALRAAGRRVPEDVAAVGFDDILDARSHTPPLTTVRNPSFALGYQAVVALLERIAGRPAAEIVTQPTRLIVRQSCGCRPIEVCPSWIGRAANHTGALD